MSIKVIREVRFRIAERNAMGLQQRVNLEPRFEPKQAPYLILCQRPCAICLHCERFERLCGQVTSLTLQCS